MAERPLVSIITPSYNQAPFLEQAIQSVFAQEYHPIEYMIIDGGSTDGSLEIIERYSNRFSWWISEPDQGQSEAINKGLKLARGEIVAWLNSDDLYLPGAIQFAVDQLQKDQEKGLVFGDAISIDQNGQPVNRLSFGDWGLTELMRFRIICQPAVFIRHAVLNKLALLEPSLHYLMDHQLWIRISQVSAIRYIGGNSVAGAKPLAAARQHPGAKNVARAADFGGEVQRILQWMETNPDLVEIVNNDRNHIRGGAYRLIARYYLDGDIPAQALKSYIQAFRYWPMYGVKHWHRMFAAILSLVGLKKTIDRIRLLSSSRKGIQLSAQLQNSFSGQLRTWPGINLHQ